MGGGGQGRFNLNKFKDESKTAFEIITGAAATALTVAGAAVWYFSPEVIPILSLLG